jgi:hypothetical protein
MKRLFIIPLLVLGLISCEKEDTSTDDPSGNNNNPGTSNLSNNTLIVGDSSTTLNMYSAFQATDVNTNKPYYDIFIFKDNVADRKQYLLIHLTEIPSSSKTLNWQATGSAPGDISADEFVVFPKLNDRRWYGEYTTDGWTNTGTMNAVVNGGKLTLSFENIELADNFLTPNVTERKDCSAKVTFNLADLQNLDTRPVMFSLTDE